MKSSGRYMSPEQMKERILSFEYIRDADHKPIGVATLDHYGHIGWSLYNSAHEDEPESKDKGLLIAWNRGLKGIGWVHHDLCSKIGQLKDIKEDASRLEAALETFNKMILRTLKGATA